MQQITVCLHFQIIQRLDFFLENREKNMLKNSQKIMGASLNDHHSVLLMSLFANISTDHRLLDFWIVTLHLQIIQQLANLLKVVRQNQPPEKITK